MLLSAWLVGALGGLHCVAMCGGFLTATGARDARAAAAVPLLPAVTVLRREMAYHGGRVATYMHSWARFSALPARPP